MMIIRPDKVIPDICHFFKKKSVSQSVMLRFFYSKEVIWIKGGQLDPFVGNIPEMQQKEFQKYKNAVAEILK